MSDITIIGLRSTGSALARTMHRAAHETTVRNRSPARMQPYIDDRIAAAPDENPAIAASPIILACTDDDGAGRSSIGSEKKSPPFRGKTLLPSSTDTRRGAVEAAGCMKRHDVSYPDGATLAGPDDTGSAAGQVSPRGGDAACSAAARIPGRPGDARHHSARSPK